jgi:hypothetical protein
MLYDVICIAVCFRAYYVRERAPTTSECNALLPRAPFMTVMCGCSMLYAVCDVTLCCNTAFNFGQGKETRETRETRIVEGEYVS